MIEWIAQLEEIRDQMRDYPLNAKGKTLKELSGELTILIEKIREYNQEGNTIREVLSPEDLPDDEDL